MFYFEEAIKRGVSGNDAFFLSAAITLREGEKA